MKTPTRMSAGRDYNYPLHGRYEYCLYADDETIVERKSGFKSKASAVSAGRKRAALLLDIAESDAQGNRATDAEIREDLRDQIANSGDC